MTIPQLIVFVVLPVAAYLLGSIPFALVIGKAHGVDIRKVGSGNVGATNLGRTLGMKYFWQAFLLDALKGFAPVFAAAWFVRLSPEPLPSWAPLISGGAAIIGHVLPIWLKFKGGKGVATGFGIVLGVWPLYTIAGLLAALVFVVVFMAFRYISVASMVGACAFAGFVAVLGLSDYPLVATPRAQLMPLLYVSIAFAALIILKHRSNISRLLKGTELKWGQKK